MFERVLLCYDGTQAGRNALKRGAQLAGIFQAKVFVLAMADAAPSAGVIVGLSGSVCLVDSVAEHQGTLRECVEYLTAQGLESEGFVAHGNPIDAIADAARRLAADLIVVGQYPRPTGGRWWSGADRAALSERVKCCIFIAVNE